jgi:hypothetical protein
MGVQGTESQPSTTAVIEGMRDLSGCTIVTEVTPGMILQDLAMGIDRPGIALKYAYIDAAGTVQPFEDWMVEIMFKDPALKGKKVAKVKLLPFVFRGTVEATPTATASTPVQSTTTTDTTVAETVADTVAQVEETFVPAQAFPDDTDWDSNDTSDDVLDLNSSLN